MVSTWKSLLTIPYHLPVHVSGNNFWVICSITFPWIEMRLSVSRSSFLKTVTFAFLHFSGRCPSCHDLLKITKSSLVQTSGSSLSIHGYNLLGLIEFYVQFKSSINESSTEAKSSLLQTLPLVSDTWYSWMLVLPENTEAKKVLSPLVFSVCVFCCFVLF